MRTQALSDQRLVDALKNADFTEALRLLEEHETHNDSVRSFPTHLHLQAITKVESVFQARAFTLSEKHVSDLRKALHSNPLEPITVWRCGSLICLVDGHHRYEAYRRHSKAIGAAIHVPVVWFSGTAREAALEAGKANCRAKLPMRPEERCNHAWRLVVADGFKVNDVVQAAAVSKRTVLNMRKAKATCVEQGIDLSGSWRRVLAALNGRSGGEWHEDEVDAEAERLADRMAKAFSTHLATHPIFTARAFDIYFGRMSHAVIREWRDLVGEPEDEEDEDFDF